MKEQDLKNRKEKIKKMFKVRISEISLLKNFNVIYDKRFDGEWYVIIEFEYKSKKYQYREDASYEWIEDEFGKEIKIK